MGTVIWDAERCILIEFLEPGKTINATHYVQTLLKLRCALHNKRPGRKVILQQNNARPHTAHLTLEKTENMGCEVLPHPLYSPDLAPSDYCLFGSVKNQIRGQHYEMNEALQITVRQISSGSWNGVLLQGNIQICRTAGKMCTEKWGLCRKISRCLWIKMMYLVFT
jgi:transposase